MKSQCASSSEGDLVTPALPEGWGEYRYSAPRTSFKSASDSLYRYAIDQYTPVSKWIVEIWVDNNKWETVEEFPTYQEAYHFTVMYILTQET